jgi:hypothetical protein
MDARLNYPNIVKTILKEYADFFASGGLTSMHTLFDDQQQSYILINIGWEGKKYTHVVVIHIDIIDKKIWVQKDNTEEGVTTDLLEAGVPKEDIVLGFHPPKVRPYTEFAVG